MPLQSFEQWKQESTRSCNAPVIMFWIGIMLWIIGLDIQTQTDIIFTNSTELKELTEGEKIYAIIFQGFAFLLFTFNSISVCTDYIYIPARRRIDDDDGQICNCVDCCCPYCKIKPYLVASLFFVVLACGGLLIQISNWYILETPLL